MEEQKFWYENMRNEILINKIIETFHKKEGKLFMSRNYLFIFVFHDQFIIGIREMRKSLCCNFFFSFKVKTQKSDYSVQ